MKINGKEVDMQRVALMIEKEYNKSNTKNQNISAGMKEYWESQLGFQRKEEYRNNTKIKYLHRPKIKYKLIDKKTNEEFIIDGQEELAGFLGYSSFNSNKRAQIYIKEITDITKEKIYLIEEII